MRVHGHQFRIRILYSDKRYIPFIKTVYDDNGFEVRLWKDSIEVYAPKNKSWDAKTVDEAFDKSLNDDFYRIFGKIQNQNHIIILKDRSENIKLAKVHIGRTNDELAKDVIHNGEKFHIYHADGRLRAIIDASHNLPELETVDARSAKPDMNAIEKQYKDFMENDPPTLTEFLTIEIKQAKNLLILTENVKEISSALRLQLLKQQSKEDIGLALERQDDTKNNRYNTEYHG